MAHRLARVLLAPLCLLPPGCGGGAPSDSAVPAEAWFVDATADAGIDFTIDRSVGGDYFMPDSMGTGCSLLDYDNDGDLDVYVVNGLREGPGVLVSPAGANRLYRQDDGGRFTDVTVASGAGHTGYGQGVATGDYDNDGDVDIYVTNYGPDALLRNEGDGTFTDVSRGAGIANPAWSSSAGFFDADGDGLLDVYVATYLDHDESRQSLDASGRLEYTGPSAFDGMPDVLYRNNGDGTFTDASLASGIGRAPSKGLGVAFFDIDGDGRQDIYVANDGRPNFAWIARGDGTFENRALALGLAVNAYGRPEASMGVAVGDTDGDGMVELLMTHLVQETNTLYRRPSGGAYADATMTSGLGAASVNYTGFGAAFLDVDLDGDLDLVCVNGRVLRSQPRAGATLNAHWTPYAEPNQLFLNDGAGLFSDASGRGGAFCRDVEVGRGLAVGDYDGDGDLDVFVANGNGTLRVYRNETPRRGRWLIVRAVDPALRRDAIGAVVEVRTGARTFRRQVRTAHSYLSASDPRVHFGLGAVARYDHLTVIWPGGDRERFAGGAVDAVVEVRRGAGEPASGGVTESGGVSGGVSGGGA